MSKFVDLTGKTYNCLTVIKRLESSKSGKSYWECKCKCGNVTKVSAANLKNGSVKSCGCLRNISRPTHNMSKTRIYHIYAGMKSRCYCSTNPRYKDYGERGIEVCNEWKNDFWLFYRWAMENGYKDGLTIERKNNDGNYEPQNCIWIHLSEQANNRRSCRMFTYNNKTQNLTQWCKELNLNYKRIHDRIYRGNWDFEKAISTPCDVSKRNKAKRRTKHGGIYKQ